VETFALPISTFNGIRFRKVHPLGHPAFGAIGKRGRFYEFSPDPEFPAVDAETAVLGRFLFIRKTLYLAFGHRQDAIIIIGHDYSDTRVHQYMQDEHKKGIFLSAEARSPVIFIFSTILKTIQHQK
jgi:hypothetical protein